MTSLDFIIMGVLAIASTVASTFGFGVALIAMPVLAAITDMKTGAPLVALGIMTVVGVVLIREWREVQMQSVWRLIVASVVGVPVGLLMLKVAPDKPMKLSLAAIIILFSLYCLFAAKRLSLKTDRSSYVFGVMSGIFGGAYTIPGPPVIVYGLLRSWPPATFKATMLGYFFPSTALMLAGHYAAGLWSDSVFRLFALSLPGILLGIALGTYLNRRVPPGKFDRATHVLLILIGLALGYQVLME